MNTALKFKQHPDCLIEDMDGELLLFNPTNSTTLHLNGPSMVVWNLCTGEHSVAQMVEVLQEAFPEQSEQIEGDVISVIKELSENSVIIAVSETENS